MNYLYSFFRNSKVKEQSIDKFDEKNSFCDGERKPNVGFRNLFIKLNKK